jgi:hypothetical protein
MALEPEDAEYIQDFVECPFLHTFDLLCDGTPIHTAGHLLRRLSLPALRDFQLKGIDFGRHENTLIADSLLAFLAASTRLESINIDGAMFSKTTLIDIFCRLPPGVRHITIARPVWEPRLEDATFDDEILEALTASPGPGLSTCPALEEVVIHYCPKVSDEAILRFIMSRMPTLKLVDIKFDRERKVDILPTLQPYVEAGLKTSISYITFPSPRSSPWAGLPDTTISPFGLD